MARKLIYAFEELLSAAGVPHRVQRTDSGEGWDLFYGDRPPHDGALWMAASPEAHRFFAETGGRIEAVETVRLAGDWIRLPVWPATRPGAPAHHAAAESSPPPLPDLAAAAFFFLSRWEEWQAPERDRFGRFPLSASVFGRGLWSLNECPVEAYARSLRRPLDQVRGGRCSVSGGSDGGSECPARDEAPASGERPRFLLGLSHDIDSIRRWDARGFARTGREAVRALVHGRVRMAVSGTQELAAGLRTRVGGKDPQQNLEEIVHLERDAGVRSSFFLLARHTHPWDGTHGPHYQRLLPALARSLGAGAEIGLHASTAAVDPASLGEERGRLVALTGAAVRGLRFHNLRGGYSALPAVAAAGFEYDSSLAFAEEPGFPAGIARPFRPYDWAQDRPLDLIEIPLAIMDTSLLSHRYLGLKIGAGRQRALLTLETLRRWGGVAALLWHNDNLPPNTAEGYAALYTELISWTRSAGGCVAPLGEIAAEWRRLRATLQGPRDEE